MLPNNRLQRKALRTAAKPGRKAARTADLRRRCGLFIMAMERWFKIFLIIIVIVSSLNYLFFS
jgi:hypothetical protein